MQSKSGSSGLHVAIVMDGNGRWATRRNLPRAIGHGAGVEALRRTVEAAPDAGIAVLTVFAFSTDNWRRPPAEVDGLMSLLDAYLRRDASRLVSAGVRLSVIGRRDRLAAGLCNAIATAEQATESGTRLHLRVAIDYSARDAIVSAAGILAAGTSFTSPGTRAGFASALADCAGTSPDVDLLIRTGGEKRLSDFLLWESAYAELCFLDVMWPDFGPEALAGAVADFARRERRFGVLPNGTRVTVPATTCAA